MTKIDKKPCQKCLILLMAGVIAAPQASAALRDPTQPPPDLIQSVEKTDKKAPYVLSSIIFASHRQRARINGQWLKRGDSLGGAIIVNISPNTVKLKGPSGIMTLVISKPGMTKTLTKNRATTP